MSGQQPTVPPPSDVTQALAMVQAGLSFLTGPAAAGQEAETLVGLEKTEARLTAARARTLSAFCTSHGYEADGQFGPKPWLRAFTRVTRGAADGALAWMRRLEAHPAVAAALADEGITASWAREICGWTSRLPAELIQTADTILLTAAARGAELADLANLAWEMIERSAAPSSDDGGFGDRAVWLESTLGGAGRLGGDLTSGCAAALNTVLNALGGKAGPEDTRSAPQRRHDALEEACQRLIGAGLVPGRDGQPLHVYAHLDLATLAGLSGGDEPARRPAAAGPGDWCPAGPEADAAACDATVIPVVTGQVDVVAADGLTAPAPESMRDLLLQKAVTLLSGPHGLAAQLRTNALNYPFNSRSQPLDLGTPTPIIPAALRRAVTLRDKHCRFPGCSQPPSTCQVHHLRPRAHDGPTALSNLSLLCRFHHLIAVHRWGWVLSLHPDGIATARHPSGRTLTSPQRT